MYKWTNGSELYHHGILGQKWGIRRFQNKDGSYTEAGNARRNGNYTSNANAYVETSTFEQRRNIEKNEVARKAQNRMMALSSLPIASVIAGAGIGSAVAGVIPGAFAGAMAGGWIGAIVGIGAQFVNASRTTKKLIDIDKKYLEEAEGYMNTGRSNKTYDAMTKEEKKQLLTNAKSSGKYPRDYEEVIGDWNIPKKDRAKLFEQYMDDPKDFYDNRDRYLGKYDHW